MTFVRLTRIAIVLLAGFIAFLGLRALGEKPSRAGKTSVVKTITFRGAKFDVVELPLDKWDVRVEWTEGGTQLKDVKGALRTNAGIFEPGYVPTGLLISDGVEKHALTTSSGGGNFFMLPNGVFALKADGTAFVVETPEFSDNAVRFATQSGPLLVKKGALHPKFNQDSPNKALRSGVGVRDGKHVVIVISRDDVNLWTFASLFRDELKCPDALYLDGVISALWADGAGRDADLEKGPFAGVLTASPRK